MLHLVATFTFTFVHEVVAEYQLLQLIGNNELFQLKTEIFERKKENMTSARLATETQNGEFEMVDIEEYRALFKWE